MQPAEPQKQHQWLQQLLGDWTFESECAMGPGQPPSKHKGSERVRSFGGLWVLCEGQGEISGGGTGLTLFTFGFDPATKRFVGTFVGSMMPQLWVYDGELDAAGKVLTLHTEGPSFTEEGKLAKYKDVFEIKTDDHRVLTSHSLGADGKWSEFMRADYRRKK